MHDLLTTYCPSSLRSHVFLQFPRGPSGADSAENRGNSAANNETDDSARRLARKHIDYSRRNPSANQADSYGQPIDFDVILEVHRTLAASATFTQLLSAGLYQKDMFGTLPVAGPSLYPRLPTCLVGG
jgi:hypothetical protein